MPYVTKFITLITVPTSSICHLNGEKIKNDFKIISSKNVKFQSKRYILNEDESSPVALAIYCDLCDLKQSLFGGHK